MTARLVAVSTGRPREVEWQGEKVLTSIFKEPVAGRVRVGRLNIEGDEQSDLEVHGGEDKPVRSASASPPWLRLNPESLCGVTHRRASGLAL